MSGFHAVWLDLREAADRAARDTDLIAMLSRHVAACPGEGVVDIGCGTGATFRALGPALPEEARWLMVDNDPLLLEAARQRLAGSAVANQCLLHDLADLEGLPLKGTALVTASALFDLCSDAFCTAIATKISDAGCALYAALTYNGLLHWTIAHPLDSQVVDGFNLHQRGDKGFGPALGPDATMALALALSRKGRTVFLRKSPWVLDASAAALQRAFLEGFRQPLREVGMIDMSAVEDWLSFRLAMIEQPGSLCHVGHFDLLSLPD
ncbi:class I SAM-dependent methyltransferase [Martelella alba]|uniref:Class I SAM-dependent methyltransferase n=1 Tax=Martelella alba TaxID=2590451 RepID=A0A506U0E5_9HYPH|nr:class I SAM-dependent methyltransferase [Martelella alba]TPW27802.1 class I SAM-dependent methyltransferase [Martelella alba]